jgi:hypothetical protein
VAFMAPTNNKAAAVGNLASLMFTVFPFEPECPEALVTGYAYSEAKSVPMSKVFFKSKSCEFM